MKKEYNSEPVFNRKCLKAEIKSYNRKINTNLHNSKIPNEGFQRICLSIILINHAFKTGKKCVCLFVCFFQVFLEECKYVVKEKRCLSILLTK